jgi:hypothetical protein
MSLPIERAGSRHCKLRSKPPRAKRIGTECRRGRRYDHPVIGVSHRTERRGAHGVSDRGQLRGRIVGVTRNNAARHCQRRSAPRRVIGDQNLRAPLRNSCKAVGVVVCVDHLRLARNAHRNAPPRKIISVGNSPLWGRLRQETVHLVKGARDRAPDAVNEARQAIPFVQRKTQNRNVGKSGAQNPIERIVCVSRRLILAVDKGENVVV